MSNLHIDKISFIRWNTVEGKRGLKDLLVEVYGDYLFYFNDNSYGYYLDEVSKTKFNTDYLNWYIAYSS